MCKWKSNNRYRNGIVSYLVLLGRKRKRESGKLFFLVFLPQSISIKGTYYTRLMWSSFGQKYRSRSLLSFICFTWNSLFMPHLVHLRVCALVRWLFFCRKSKRSFYSPVCIHIFMCMLNTYAGEPLKCMCSQSSWKSSIIMLLVCLCYLTYWTLQRKNKVIKKPVREMRL